MIPVLMNWYPLAVRQYACGMLPNGVSQFFIQKKKPYILKLNEKKTSSIIGRYTHTSLVTIVIIIYHCP